MTPQQYNEAKEILAGAPKWATHYGEGDAEIRAGYAKLEEGIQFEMVEGNLESVWPECQSVSVTRSLSDLKMLVEMYERDRWIPVSERLPDKSGDYQVYNPTSVYQNIYTETFHGDCKWRNSNGFITHWKPLPAPPCN